MLILIAPDSFKGCLSAQGVAAAMAAGLQQAFPEAELLQVPVADGGEGTVAALVRAAGGSLRVTVVQGPLETPVAATWGILGDGVTAVIEMAAASGLPLVPPGQRDAGRATSFGTGQLIQAALDQGLRRILIGLGGSATTDGGSGMARALGVRFLDADGQDLPNGGLALAELARIDFSGLDPRLRETVLEGACDVDNPLCGPRGAALTYGPQKGADPALVAALEAALETFARAAAAATGRDVAALPGSGAGGGLGAGLRFFTGARLRPGVELVLEAVGFAVKVETANLVITGEGRTDLQTLNGKAPLGVAAAAAQAKVPVVCLSGALGPGAEVLLQHGFTALMSVAPGPIALEASLAEAPVLIRDAAARLGGLLRAGMLLEAGLAANAGPGIGLAPKP